MRVIFWENGERNRELEFYPPCPCGCGRRDTGKDFGCLSASDGAGRGFSILFDSQQEAEAVRKALRSRKED